MVCFFLYINSYINAFSVVWPYCMQNNVDANIWFFGRFIVENGHTVESKEMDSTIHKLIYRFIISFYNRNL